ncbi:MAG: RNA polymerase sigma factor, partial [Syntrophorhabdus sp.]
AWPVFRGNLGLAVAPPVGYNSAVRSFTMVDLAHEDNVVSDSTDPLYITRVLGGDRNAFSFLLKKYKMYVLKIVNRHVPYEDAEEVAHDAFIRAYESLAKFKGPEGFRSWLAAIATRTCYDYWRQAYRKKEIPMSSLGDEHREWIEKITSGSSGTSAEEAASQVEAREILSWALARLTPEDRMVLELIYMEGLSVREVADLLGWSTANVKIRSFRSRNKLHKLLKNAGKK